MFSQLYNPLPPEQYTYTKLPEDALDPRGVIDDGYRAKRARPCAPSLLLCGSMAFLVSIALSSTMGYYLGLNRHHREAQPSPVSNASPSVPQVPLDLVQQTFRYDADFAAPPSAPGEREPVWDSLIPDGLGYVEHPSLAPEFSVVSAFHQLHCLYTIRRAFYSRAAPDSLEDFDFGLNRTEHAAHCFEYLRQSLVCSADSSIEPAGARVDGFLGWGFPRQCRDFGQLKQWAARWRVFDAHGFLPAVPPEEKRPG